MTGLSHNSCSYLCFLFVCLTFLAHFFAGNMSTGFLMIFDPHVHFSQCIHSPADNALVSTQIDESHICRMCIVVLCSIRFEDWSFVRDGVALLLGRGLLHAPGWAFNIFIVHVRPGQPFAALYFGLGGGDFRVAQPTVMSDPSLFFSGLSSSFGLGHHAVYPVTPYSATAVTT
jgi:hypothetical protein